MYRFDFFGSIIRESDGACIPPDPNNSDYAALLASGAEIAPYVPPPLAVPQFVTPWQAREALRLAGLLAAVNTHIEGLGENHQVYIAWHYAERIARNSPLIAALAPTFNLSEQQLDDLFIVAAGRQL